MAVFFLSINAAPHMELRGVWVIIDATELVRSDWRLESADLRALASWAKGKGVRLGVPAVVLQEAVRNFTEEVEGHARKASDALAKFTGLTRRTMDVPITPQVAGEAVREYRKGLGANLTKLGIEVLGYPAVSHEDLVQRDLGGRKPFNRDGSGYRDSLVWETCLEKAREGVPVVLVSRNSRDFGSPGDLPLDLMLDLNLAGLPHTVLVIVASVAELNASRAATEFGPLPQAKGRSLGALLGAPAADTVREQISAALQGASELGRFMTPAARDQWPDYQPSDLIELGLAPITSAATLPSGEYLVEFPMDFVMVVSEWEWLDKPYQWWYEVHCWGRARLTFHPKTGELTSAAVVEIDRFEIDRVSEHTQMHLEDLDMEQRLKFEAEIAEGTDTR